MGSATNLAHETDFIAAAQSICEADDGSGSVVDRDGDPLTDTANSMVELVDSENPIPLVDWSELQGSKIPIAAINLGPIDYMGGTADRWMIEAQLDTWAPEGKSSIASALANRLQDILNYNNFNSEGLDVSHHTTTRNRTPADQQGAKRISMTMMFKLNR